MLWGCASAFSRLDGDDLSAGSFAMHTQCQYAVTHFLASAGPHLSTAITSLSSLTSSI